jgi:hypothetical protein
MKNVPAYIMAAQFRCMGTYEALVGAAPGALLTLELSFDLATSTFPAVPSYFNLPSQMRIEGVSVLDGGSGATVWIDDEPLEILQVYVRNAPSGTLAGATIGLRFAQSFYPYQDWGTRLICFAGGELSGTLYMAGFFDPGIPSGLPHVQSEPVNWECLAPNTLNDHYYQGIVPLGALNPSTGHVFPTPHHLMMLADPMLPGVSGHVYAPTDGILYRLVHRIILESKYGTGEPPYIVYNDFTLHLAATTQYDLILGHVHALASPAFMEEDIEGLAYGFGSADVPVSKAEFNEGNIPGLLDPFAMGYMSPSEETPNAFTKEVDIARPVASEAHLGSVGDYPLFDGSFKPQRNLGFGGVNYTQGNHFLASGYYALFDEPSLFADSPFLHTSTRNLQIQVQERLWRLQDSDHPPFGQVCYDKAGTLAGNWFRLGVEGEERTYPASQLAFVYDVFDPNRPLISIGDEDLWLWHPHKGQAVQPLVCAPAGVFDDGVYRAVTDDVVDPLWSAPLSLTNPGTPFVLAVSAYRTEMDYPVYGAIVVAADPAFADGSIRVQTFLCKDVPEIAGFVSDGEVLSEEWKGSASINAWYVR